MSELVQLVIKPGGNPYEELIKHINTHDWLLWWAKDIYGLHSTAVVVRPCTAMVLWRSR